MSALTVVAAAVVGYLFGSIPVGYLVVRATRGVYVRTVGSGRTGGTNAMRAGGLGAGVMTAIGDMLKGLAAVAIMRLLSGGVPEIEAIAGLGAVAGHNWSLFMGFKGGAGTAPNIGACIMFWPLSALWLVPMVPLGVFVVGYASVTSLVIAVVIPITFALRAAAGLTSWVYVCLLYTSDAADERSSVDLGGHRILKKKKTSAAKSRVESSSDADAVSR